MQTFRAVAAVTLYAVLSVVPLQMASAADKPLTKSVVSQSGPVTGTSVARKCQAVHGVTFAGRIMRDACDEAMAAALVAYQNVQYAYVDLAFRDSQLTWCHSQPEYLTDPSFCDFRQSMYDSSLLATYAADAAWAYAYVVISQVCGGGSGGDARGGPSDDDII